MSFFSPQNNNNFKLNIVDLKIKKKIFIKQSYVMLTWFYYISFLKKKNNSTKDNFKLKIKYLPITKRIFTNTKAPMAHKTRSKEQFAYSYYSFLVTFRAEIRNSLKFNTLDKGLLLVFLTKKNFQIFETNVFFLKFFKFLFTANVSNFLNFYKYLN